MKRITGIILAAILCVTALVGCGSDSGSVSTDGSTSMEKVIGAAESIPGG